ncbi:MAG TPA: hypothetical protein VJU87_01840 [Gemmatimonadaceae bacterium]|nr:hypothetical protein [Gemmatimonadaceae bacterium]
MNRTMLVTTTVALAATSFLAAAAQTPASAAASGQTLAPSPMTSGGYGAPVQRLSAIAGKSVLFTGLEGGWIMNHRFVLGAAGYGLATQNVRNPGAALRDSRGRAPVVEMGYGGVTFGYVPQSTKLVHLSFQTLIGGGGLTYDMQDIAGVRPEDAPADGFFVLEPSVEGELNVTRFFRIGVGAGYRFVSGASLEGLGDRDLRGASASLTFRLGRF